MNFRLIAEEKPHHPVSRLARVLGVSRAGFYAWQKRPPSNRARADAELTRRISQIHEETDGIYGAPRIQEELADEHDLRVGRKRVARLMRAAGLEGVSRRRRFRVGTTSPGGEAPAAPDLVERDFSAERPNQLWFADITYVPTWQGWLYLAVIIDACSRYCVGWSMRDDLGADLVYDALGMAVTRRRPGAELIHHSDRGSQYRSLVFGKLLAESGIMPSMGSRGDAYDNAAIESFMASIKTELINRRRFKTKDEARTAIFSYIEAFYNPRRRHKRLGQKSPAAYEKMLVTAQLEPTTS
jgi:putative transposase